MKNIPKFIHLQTGLEDSAEMCEDFNDLQTHCITWSVDEIYSDDLSFISVSFLREKIKELEEKLTPEISTQTRVTILFTINELKNLIK